MLTIQKSIVWVDENKNLHVFPFKHHVEADNDFTWSRPESIIFVHDRVDGTRLGRGDFEMHLTDQILITKVTDIYRFQGDVEDAVAGYLINNDRVKQWIEPMRVDVACLIADDDGLPEGMSALFNVELSFSPEYSDECPACVLHADQAHKIIDFLNEAVFIRKNSNLGTSHFVQKNMKKAIFVNDTTLPEISRWFVDTFRVTFERAKIETIAFVDVKRCRRHVEAV